MVKITSSEEELRVQQEEAADWMRSLRTQCIARGEKFWNLKKNQKTN
jgi:hypothetical protein